MWMAQQMKRCGDALSKLLQNQQRSWTEGGAPETKP